MPFQNPSSPIYINTLPEYDFSGFGQLGAALLNYYRSRTPGPHQLNLPGGPPSLRFPSGAFLESSPQEIAAIQARGGVPTTTGQTVPFRTGFGTLLPRGGVSYVPPPSLQQQTNIAQLQQAQANAALAQSLGGVYKAYEHQLRPPTLAPEPKPEPSGIPQPRTFNIPESVTSNVLRDLATRAIRGDTQAADNLRRLALERDDPEAIAILQAWGEL